jgi:hypothetical protein
MIWTATAAKRTALTAAGHPGPPPGFHSRTAVTITTIPVIPVMEAFAWCMAKRS